MQQGKEKRSTIGASGQKRRKVGLCAWHCAHWMDTRERFNIKQLTGEYVYKKPEEQCLPIECSL